MSVESFYNVDLSERTIECVVVMYNGTDPSKKNQAWGETYSDGQSTSYGWVPATDLEKVKLCNPEFCKLPTDVTYVGSPYTGELEKNGKIVPIRLTTTMELM